MKILLLNFQRMIVVMLFMTLNIKNPLKRGCAVRFVSLFGKPLLSHYKDLLWIFRAPDTSKVKQKMLYASSKDAIRKKLIGIGTEVQATDASEISFEAVLEKVKSI